jgi:hypothetical protein
MLAARLSAPTRLDAPASAPATATSFALRVPELEPSARRVEVFGQLRLEELDLAAKLEHLVIEPALGVAFMPLVVLALDRGSALWTGDVPRNEHLS